MDNAPGQASVLAQMDEQQEQPSSAVSSLVMSPITGEEVNTSIEKEGISFIFESRSLSSVIRFVYTPIDGTFADLELEINKADPILPADEGGITIEMGGKAWPADSEEIERHFVSCEQIGDSVEARWQWKCGEELADFLYRFSISGKSLVIEVEGGHGKATGMDLGKISGAIHPRPIPIPYFNLGDGSPHILCTSGVFISSLLDWNCSQATGLWAPDTVAPDQAVRINGGCSYQPMTDGKRLPLRERWLLTVSRQFEEVMPSPPTALGELSPALKEKLWYNVPTIPPTEESYVDLYEGFRTLKHWGLDDLLINHPDETWHDGDGNATLTLDGAMQKGGEDALSEYLEAVEELGFAFSLCTNYGEIAATHPQWAPEMGALLPDGNPAPATTGRYRLKPSKGITLAPDHSKALVEKYKPSALYFNRHAAQPPWTFVDADSSWEQAGSFFGALQMQRALLQSQASSLPGPVVGEGGHHWLYAGILDGYLARMSGPAQSRLPLLVDFDLHYLHGLQLDAGLGTPEEFFGETLSAEDKHSRSPFLDRFLTLTVAYGHAGLLPSPESWGLPSAVKTYYLLRQLQSLYLGVPVETIRYHHEGNLLETTEALISGAYEAGQVQIGYQNGLQIWVNGGWEGDWEVECAGAPYSLPPASFVASGPDDLLVYSADAGSGRIDFARCGSYFYCDTRGQKIELPPLVLNGAALVFQGEWEIDILPLEYQGEIEIDISHFWTDRRLPQLRVLGFRPDEDEPENFKAVMEEQQVRFEPVEEFYRYRITLPEWMVEPGR